jgi:uncharacterized protein (UPF0179 family)
MNSLCWHCKMMPLCVGTLWAVMSLDVVHMRPYGCSDMLRDEQMRCMVEAVAAAVAVLLPFMYMYGL